MMETNVNYTLVGAFVIFLILLIVFCVIWLSGGLSMQPYSTYQVNMTEPVSGLNLQAPVEFNGVLVGHVAHITINHNNPQLVELLLDVKSDTPVTMGTHAKLGVKLLSGVAYILLEDKGTNMQPLVAAEGQEYPIIPTVPSLLVKLDTAITEMTTSFKELKDAFHNFFDEKNMQAIKGTLNNLHTFTNMLSRDSDQLNEIINNTSRATQVLETQTLPGANQMFTNFNGVAQNFNAISSQIKSNPSILIRGKEQSRLGPGEQ